MNKEPVSRSERRRKKRGSGSVRIPVLLCILAVVVAAAFALMLPVFNVTEVYCEGNSAVKYEDIMNAARIDTGKNIFLENLGGAERRIEAIPRVKAAELKRVFPNRICITITEREAYAYIPASGGYALVADDGIVIEIPGGDTSGRISQAKIPVLDSDDTDAAEDKPSSDKDSKKSEDTESEDAESSNSEGDTESSEEDQENSDSVAESGEGETKASESGAADSGEQGTEIANVPATAGVELKDAAEGKKAESDNVDRLSKIYELCRGLKGADLLNRTTYINIENMEDIRLVIENRLEVLLGKADNIDYRCKFLAEVINTKISASESVILDYRGDDIYAENRDDGKDRVDKSVRKKAESKSNSEKSAGSTSGESGRDRENMGTDDDSEDDTDSGTGGSTKRTNSADLSEDEEEE